MRNAKRLNLAYEKSERLVFECSFTFSMLKDLTKTKNNSKVKIQPLMIVKKDEKDFNE